MKGSFGIAFAAALERFGLPSAERRSIRIVFREHGGHLLGGAAGEMQTAELILLVIPDGVAAAPLPIPPVIPEVIAEAVEEAPAEAIPPDAELIPRRQNWVSGELLWVGFGVRYDRNITDWFSVGASAFMHFMPGLAGDPDEYTIGALATARFFPFGSPFYFELGLGWGHLEMDLPVYNYRYTGPVIAPALGLRLGGRERDFFVNPFLRVPTVFDFVHDRNEIATIILGVGLGWAW